MFRGSFGGKPILSSAHEAANLAKLRKPVPPGFDRTTSFTNPLGPEPGRGWILMLRRDLDLIDLNADKELIFEFEAESGVIEQRKLYSIVVTQEPICITPSHVEDDPLAAYLVEVADRRHLVNSRNLEVATWNNYDSTSTWATVITDLWNLVKTHLGQTSAPSLPASPVGTPINVNFAGESAWKALNRVLAFQGMAIACNPLLPDGQFSIVLVGDDDDAQDAAIEAYEAAGRKIHDGVFPDVVRGRVPAGVRVYFPQHPDRHARDPVYSDVANPNNTAAQVQANLYVPLWDNTFAIHDATGAVSNQAALDTQAAARAVDYFRMLEDGGRRTWKRFSGLCEIIPGAKLKSVTWAEQPGVGVYTDLFNNPYILPEEVGFERKPVSVRTGWAPVRLVAFNLPAYTRSGNTITFTASGSQSADGTATAIGDRVLLAIGAGGCTGDDDNGIWHVTTKGTGGTQEVWKRALDADNSDDFRSGFTVTISDGVRWIGSEWRLYTHDPITLNTTALAFVPVKPFHARILSRTESSCGNSGSGSGDTDHALFTYAVHSVRFVDDGDGCPATVLDDIDVAITGTAYEVNNNAVAIGTVVEVESVTYTDEQVSGSGSDTTGPAGCRLVFSHEAETEDSIDILLPVPDPPFRYFCITGDPIQREYIANPDGTYTFVRYTGVCCACPAESGSGSGASNVCCDPGDDLCLTVSNGPYDGLFNGSYRFRRSGTGNVWYHHTNQLSEHTSWLTKTQNPDGTCTWILKSGFVDNSTGFGWGMFGVASSATCSPFELVFSTIILQWTTPNSPIPDIGSGTGVVVEGDCGHCDCAWEWYGLCGGQISGWSPVWDFSNGAAGNGTGCIKPTGCGVIIVWPNGGEIRQTNIDGSRCSESGSGGSPGNCPCTWRCVSGAWNLIAGGVGCINPPGGTFVCPTNDAIAYTEESGAVCDPDEGPSCAECGTANRSANASGNGWLQPIPNVNALTYSNGIWESAAITLCEQQTSIVFWCEAGRWFITLLGLGQAFEARPGSTCSEMIFDIITLTDNTFCPGQQGNATITVTL